jgi:tyrosinase
MLAYLRVTLVIVTAAFSFFSLPVYSMETDKTEEGFLLVRKSVRTLSAKEKARYVEGVKRLKNIGTASGRKYDDYVEIHAMSMMQDDEGGAAHEGPAFLPWHRQFILQFEKDLQEVLDDTTFSLPYWDWEWDSNQKDPKITPVWTDDFMGSDGYPVRSGPFTPDQWKTITPHQMKIHTLQRPKAINPLRWKTFTADDAPAELWRSFALSVPILPTQEDINILLSLKDYDVAPWTRESLNGFRNMLEGWIDANFNRVDEGQPLHLHNRVHQWVGGEIDEDGQIKSQGQMNDVMIAPNDPVFFLHHCNIDRIWAQWQDKYPKSDSLYPTKEARQGHNLNDSMYPWNDPKKDFRTPKDLLDYKKLGYKYE